MTKIRFDSETALNVPNINDLNNVVISSTEPTTGEEVWLQKGKNLFDINSIVFDKNVTGTISENTITVEVNWQQGDFFGASFELNNLKKNTNYTVSANTLINNFKNTYVYTDALFGTNIAIGSLSDGVVFNTGNNTRVVIGLYLTSPTTGNTYSMSNLQVEQGETATNYEPYVDKKIYTKNDNGVYEEFYDETNREVYSTGERRIGTWIDGKPLYRKVINCGALPDTNTKTVNTYLPNTKIRKVEGTAINESNNYVLPLPYHDVNNANDSVTILCDNNSNIILTTKINRSNFNGYVTLEYTKTTD